MILVTSKPVKQEGNALQQSQFTDHDAGLCKTRRFHRFPMMPLGHIRKTKPAINHELNPLVNPRTKR